MQKNSSKTKRKPRNMTLTDHTVKLMDKQRRKAKVPTRSMWVEYLITNYVDRGEQN